MQAQIRLEKIDAAARERMLRTHASPTPSGDGTRRGTGYNGTLPRKTFTNAGAIMSTTSNSTGMRVYVDVVYRYFFRSQWFVTGKDKPKRKGWYEVEQPAHYGFGIQVLYWDGRFWCVSSQKVRRPKFLDTCDYNLMLDQKEFKWRGLTQRQS